MAALLAQEVLDHQAVLEREAAAVLPGDHDTCTYVPGLPRERQKVYACWTCVPPGSGKLAGVCYSCSISCHAQHDLIELFTKRDFVCDCGNSLFGGFRCTLTPDKTPLNPSNRYNHNFCNRYCRCDQPYDPDTEQDMMHQCASCEDWFHTRCLYHPPPATDDAFAVFLCALCVRNRPTLLRHRFRPDITPGYRSAAPAPAAPTLDDGDNVEVVEADVGDKRHADDDAGDSAKRLKQTCIVQDTPACDDDTDLFLGARWEASLCTCEDCAIKLHLELQDVRQFVETMGAEDDDTGNEEEEPAPSGPAEVTSMYDLGLAALGSLPGHQQRTVAFAILTLVQRVKAGLQQLRDQGVTEITTEHIEQLKAQFLQEDAGSSSSAT